MFFMIVLLIIGFLVLLMIAEALTDHSKNTSSMNPEYVPYRYNRLSFHDIETTITMLNAKWSAILQRINDDQSLTDAQKKSKIDEERSKFEKENEVRIQRSCTFTASLKDNFIITNVADISYQDYTKKYISVYELTCQHPDHKGVFTFKTNDKMALNLQKGETVTVSGDIFVKILVNGYLEGSNERKTIYKNEEWGMMQVRNNMFVKRI